MFLYFVILSELEQRIKEFQDIPEIDSREVICRKYCIEHKLKTTVFRHVTPDYYQQNLYQRRYEIFSF